MYYYYAGKHVRKLLSSHWSVLITGTLLATGLLIRLYWMQFDGYDFDVNVNRIWGLSALKYGLVESYSSQLYNNMLPNYPPFSIVLFKYFSAITKLTHLSAIIPLSILQNVAIKLPSLCADVLISSGLWYYLKERTHKGTAMVIAALYFAHPAAMYNSAYWGQTDAIFTMFIFFTALALIYKRFTMAGILAALAVLTKTQAVIFIPMFAVFALFYGGALRKSILWFCIVFLLACIPFIVLGYTDALMNVYSGAVGFYSYTSFNAYNFWWVLYSDTQPQDTELIFSFISHRAVGLALFSAVYALGIGLFVREQRSAHSKFSKELALFAAMALIAGGFFVFATQMHERYLFPFIVLSLPLLITMPRFIVPVACMGIAYLWNLLGALPYGPIDQAVYAQFPGWDIVIAATMVACFIWFAVEAIAYFVRPREVTALAKH